MQLSRLTTRGTSPSTISGNKLQEQLPQEASPAKSSSDELAIRTLPNSDCAQHGELWCTKLEHRASEPPASEWPRRGTRSANNPPAHPEDERRRARSLPAWDYPPKSLLVRGPRLPPRQAASRRFFPQFFRLSFFSQNGFFGGPPGTLKLTPNCIFLPKIRFQGRLLVH